jgi:hypothetical protein
MARPKGSGMAEAEVVPAVQLKSVIEAWIDRYESERTPNYHWNPLDNYFTALNWLCSETGMGHRTIQRILKLETKYVALRNADLLLTAIGESYLLSTGEISVVPNPKWTQEHFVAYMESRGCI